MNFSTVQFHINAYRQHHQTLEAARFLIRSFNLEHPNFAGFQIREGEGEPNNILLTAEGQLGGPTIVKIPKNLFNFDLSLVLNLIAHEMLHVRQKAKDTLVEDKNEREFQAYYEMLFHPNFPQIPDAPDFNRKQFAQKALTYYQRMAQTPALQQAYTAQKNQVEALLHSFS